MRDVAKFLPRLKVAPDLIVTSPLPRASQTEKIAAEYLKAKVREDELLAPGFGVSELRTVLKRHHSKVLILVGHEPDFTNIISGLTGASLKLSKAGVALLDIDPEAEEGKLLWLFPPKFSRKSKWRALPPASARTYHPNLGGRWRYGSRNRAGARRKSVAPAPPR